MYAAPTWWPFVFSVGETHRLYIISFFFFWNTETGFLWIAFRWGCTRTTGKQITSSPTRSPCTCSPAYGTPTNGPREVGWRRRTGPGPHLCHLTRTSASTAASGRTPILPACPPPPTIGGINIKLGICRILRKWTLLGCRETLLYMIIARTMNATRRCPGSVRWARGIDQQLNSYFILSIFF